MAILGIGVDIVELSRIEEMYERHGEAFLRRFCRPGEWQERRGAAFIQHLGGLFAAKEATLKALGTGWAQGLGLTHVEVVRGEGGAPRIRLHAAAAERAAELGAGAVHVSITHESAYAVAMTVIESQE